jgi:hypothetical protein
LRSMTIPSSITAPSPRGMVLFRSDFFSLEAIAFAIYIIRDAFGGALRYYFAIFHVPAAWFLPDVLAILCLGQFILHCIIRNRSIVAALVLLQIFLSLGIGYFFLGSFTALSSSMKMMLPVFVGFCFCDSDLGQYKKFLLLLAAIFYVSVVGVIASKYWKPPWVGFQYESFGSVRQAGRLWWAGSEQRLSGFAGDNTMAGLFILITFVVTSVRRNLLWCVVFGGIALYTIKLTTSKTTMGVLSVYLILLIVVRLLPERLRFPAVRLFALCSFAAILVPIVLILLFSGSSIGNKEMFFSLMDRVNNSWQLPFIYMAQLMPIGFVTGCGVGCFNYPQPEFSNLASYWMPIDNFYIGTYVMFGVPFIVFMFMVFRATFLVTDIYKLSLIFTVNLFTITVLNYGPATGLLIIALSFSEVLSQRSSVVLQEKSPPKRLRPGDVMSATGRAIHQDLPRPAA